VSVVLRMVTEGLGKKEFDKVKEAIDGNAEAMKKLGSEASDLQMSIIQNNIIDMCREADEKTIDLVEVQLVSYLNVLQAVLILDTNFAIEVSRVHAVVILAAETFKKEEYPSLQSQKDEFVAKKTRSSTRPSPSCRWGRVSQQGQPRRWTRCWRTSLARYPWPVSIRL
jgi:hypothetical protein